jgi:hypothetical protein
LPHRRSTASDVPEEVRAGGVVHGALMRAMIGRPAPAGVTDGDRLAVGIVALAAGILALCLFALKAASPIWDDGALVLTDRLPATIDSVLRPYHEHLNAVPILLWGAMAALYGTQNPGYLVLLLTSHVALAVGTAAFLVSRVGPTAGLAIALPLALLGSAHYDLLMPFQIVFTVPLLFGLGATWLALPRDSSTLGRIGIAAALVIGVATSAVGLFVIVALGIWFWLDDRRHQLLELLPALFIWAAWFVSFGIRGLADDGASRASLVAIAPYTLTAIASGLGGLVGCCLSLKHRLEVGSVGAPSLIPDHGPAVHGALLHRGGL